VFSARPPNHPLTACKGANSLGSDNSYGSETNTDEPNHLNGRNRRKATQRANGRARGREDRSPLGLQPPGKSTAKQFADVPTVIVNHATSKFGIAKSGFIGARGQSSTTGAIPGVAHHVYTLEELQSADVNIMEWDGA
jgi:hypothetical protein